MAAVKKTRSIIAIAEGEDVLIEITLEDGEILDFKTDDINFVIESLRRAREKAWECEFQRKTRERQKFLCAICKQSLGEGRPLYLDGKWYCEGCQDADSTL